MPDRVRRSIYRDGLLAGVEEHLSVARDLHDDFDGHPHVGGDHSLRKVRAWSAERWRPGNHERPAFLSLLGWWDPTTN